MVIRLLHKYKVSVSQQNFLFQTEKLYFFHLYLYPLNNLKSSKSKYHVTIGYQDAPARARMRPEAGVGVQVGEVSVGGGAVGPAVVVHLHTANWPRVVVDIVVLQWVRRHGLTHPHCILVITVNI